MDVTLRNIRREYATESALWIRVMALAATVLAAAEGARQVVVRGGAWWLAVTLAVVLAAIGWCAAGRLAKGVRRTSLDAELWRKFGLHRDLLAACGALPALDHDAEAEVDRALLSLRTLAALGNHDVWDAADTPDLADLVGLGEGVLAAALAETTGLAHDRIRSLADELALASDGLTAALAALLRDDAEGVQTAWEAVEGARERLARRPRAELPDE